MMLHLQLKEQIEQHFAARLNRDVVLLQDALQLSLDNGVEAEIRYLNPAEYSIHWLYGEAGFRVDTAPLHADLKTFPNHMHDMEGNVLHDRLTVHGAEPWHNVRAVLDALIENPLLN
jgi:hypothetical protein